jgi:hypothetical protein
MTKYALGCEGIRKQVSLLQIVTRRIFDNKLASFSMHQPAEANGLLGWIEVTVIPGGHLAVTGDYDTCVFSRYSGEHWRGAIQWLSHHPNPSAYVCDKAQIGMGQSMLLIDKDKLHADLEELVEDDSITVAVMQECVDILSSDEWGIEHALYDVIDVLKEHELEGEDFQDLGEVPSYAVVASTAILHRLNELLELEEKEGTTTT